MLISALSVARNPDTEVGEQPWDIGQYRSSDLLVREMENWRFVGAELTFQLGDSQAPEVHLTTPGGHGNTCPDGQPCGVAQVKKSGHSTAVIRGDEKAGLRRDRHGPED